jgi:hypothetical protein
MPPTDVLDAPARRLEFVCAVCLASAMGRDDDPIPKCERCGIRMTPDSDEPLTRYKRSPVTPQRKAQEWTVLHVPAVSGPGEAPRGGWRPSGGVIGAVYSGGGCGGTWGARRRLPGAMANRTIRTAKNRKAVLAALTQGWSVHGACRQAGIGTRSYYDWRDDDPGFRADADAAIEAATDHLEDVARNRAIQHSDLLLIFLLKSRRPQVYNRKTITLAGDIDNPLLVHQTRDPEDVVHFYMPPNGRDQPEPEEPDAPRTIEGKADAA